jgi:hypothetical protein
LVNGWIDAKLWFIGLRAFEMVDFSNSGAAKAWIQTKDVKVRCAISSRTSLRVLANCIDLPVPSFTYITLASLKAVFTASCRSHTTDQSFVWQEFSASAAARAAAIRTLLDEEGKLATEHLAAAGLAALSGTDSRSSADSAAKSISAALAAADKTGGDVYLASVVAVQKDQELIEDYNEVHASVTKLFSQPLWAGVTPPDPIQSRHDALILAFKGDSIWSFWHDWYLAMWNGTFDDWELAFEVVKIAEDVWEGQDAAQKVADEIERIKATLKLRSEIATLKEKLHAHEAIATTGHNQGPPLDDTVEVRKTIEMIWPILDDLEAEVEKEAPSPDRLKVLGQNLFDISIVIAKYCGGLANIALEKSAETIGETGTKLAKASVAATYVGTNEGVQSVAKAAWDLAKTIVGG